MKITLKGNTLNGAFVFLKNFYCLCVFWDPWIVLVSLFMETDRGSLNEMSIYVYAFIINIAVGGKCLYVFGWLELQVSLRPHCYLHSAVYKKWAGTCCKCWTFFSGSFDVWIFVYLSPMHSFLNLQMGICTENSAFPRSWYK